MFCRQRTVVPFRVEARFFCDCPEGAGRNKRLSTGSWLLSSPCPTESLAVSAAEFAVEWVCDGADTAEQRMMISRFLKVWIGPRRGRGEEERRTRTLI